MFPYLLVDDIIAAQTPKIEKPFLNIINDFDLIIEIGFHRGAFSSWLYKNKNKITEFFCYDVSLNEKLVDDNNINFILGDCFEQNVINQIKELISKKGKSLILCDGGNKNEEFKLYSQFLKKGDVVMCHDYSHSNEDFVNVSLELNWPHPSESSYDIIKPSIDKNNLSPFFYDEFKNVLWGSFVKN